MVVIDASLAFKWFEIEQEEFIEKAIKILQDHLLGKNIIVVPDLILYELSNSWSTKSRLTAKEIKIYLKDLEKYQLKLEPVNLDILNQTVDFSKKYDISVYDALYIALAKQKKCKLITSDQKLASKVNLSFVKLLEDYKI
ncbi:MAG: type II toxin-antitoxin system VapC family toxin [Candidatus Daviesbacteria bacterium]|nr:type II toxin-antitoxin system VapC family toxin [Candidatus Daviesbacteria bacterium]